MLRGYFVGVSMTSPVILIALSISYESRLCIITIPFQGGVFYVGFLRRRWRGNTGVFYANVENERGLVS